MKIKKKKNNNQNDNRNNNIQNNDSKNNEDNNKEKKNNDSNNNNNNVNNNNNNQNIDIQFIIELPPQIREEVLLALDPAMIPNLSQELQEEYLRLRNITNLNSSMLLGQSNSQNIPNLTNINVQNEEIGFNNQDLLNSTQIKDTSSDGDKEFNGLKNNYNKIQLNEYIYNIEEILSNSKNNKEYSSIILQVFDDDLLENLFLYNIKTIISYRKKSYNISYNAYFQLLNKLIINVHLRHKILDIIFILWMCDSTCVKKLYKNKNCIEKNTFIKNLYYLYTEMNLSEDYLLDDYDNFFRKFSLNYQKEMKKFFLNTEYNEKGGYIYLKKEYSITKNCQNIKELINIKYDKGENVLSNLLSLIMINSKSDIKKIFDIKIFTNIVKNCFKILNNENSDEKYNIIKAKNNNNILHINYSTIEKIIDLFNNFEISLKLNKGVKSNNPTSLLNELMLDNNVFQILLDIILKRINKLKGEIFTEMNTFFNNKNLDITLFSKPLPGIILFKLIKFVNNINSNINKKYIIKSNKNESKELIEKNIKIKKELYIQYKIFIEKIRDTLFPLNY